MTIQTQDLFEEAPVTEAKAEVAIKRSTAIIDIQAALRKQAAEAVDSTEIATGGKIKAGNGKFTLPDGASSTTLDVVIVAFNSVNEFYDRPFTPQVITPPACFAISDSPRNMQPDPDSPAIPDGGTDCNSCPMNQFGSDPTPGSRGKACKNTRIVALLPLDADDSTTPLVLKLPPTSVKAFDAYVQQIARSFNFPPIGVVTTIALDGAVSYPKFVFACTEVNNNIEYHMGRQKEAANLLRIKPDTTDYQPIVVTKAKGAKR